MSEAAAEAPFYDVDCPHCRRPFRAQLLSGRAARYHGFKCPHCKLFVPFERVEERDAADPTE